MGCLPPKINKPVEFEIAVLRRQTEECNYWFVSGSYSFVAGIYLFAGDKLTIK
jgi:hypothetical protein